MSEEATVSNPIEKEETTTIHPLFWSLADVDETVSINSIVLLVEALETFQTKKSLEVEMKELTSLTELQSYLHHDVYYSIQRLIKGLASNRTKARLGFSTALIQILKKFSFIPLNLILELVDKNLVFSKNSNSEDSKGTQIGLLFFYQSLLQSNLLEKLDSKKKKVEFLVCVLERVLSLHQVKSYLHTGWAKLNQSLIQKLEEQQREVVVESLPLFWNKVKDLTLEFPTDLVLPLTLLQIYQKLELELPKFALLQKEQVKSLAQILKRQRPDSVKDIPLAWYLVLDLITGSSQSHFVPLQSFYKVCIDETLFSSKSNPDQEYLGFQLFQHLLDVNSTPTITLLTPNLMKKMTFYSNLKNKKLVTKIAKQSQTKLLEKLETVTDFNLTLSTLTQLQKLQLKSGTTTLYTKLLTQLDENNLSNYLKYLNDILHGKEVMEGLTDESEIYKFVLEQLELTFNLSCSKNFMDVSIQSINLVLIHTLFNLEKEFKFDGLTVAKLPNKFSEPTQKLYTTKLSNLIKKVLNLPPVKQELHLTNLEKLLKIGLKQLKPSLNLDPVQNTLTQFEKVKPTAKWDAQVKSGFEKFKSVATCVLLLLDEDTNLTVAIDDVTQSLIKIHQPVKKTKSKKAKADEEEEVEHANLILIDALVALATSNSSTASLLKELSLKLIVDWSSLLDSSCLQLLLELLENAGQQDLEEEEMDELEEGEFEPMEEDENEEEDDEESDEGGSEEEESDDESEGDSDKELDQELVNQLQSALGANEAEDSEESLDDDQMFALDSKLEAVFQAQKQAKKSKAQAKLSLTQIKSTALHMLAQVLNHMTGSQLALQLVKPLFAFVSRYSNGERNKSLVDFALATVHKSLPKLKFESEVVGAMSEEVLELSEVCLQQLLQKPKESTTKLALNILDFNLKLGAQDDKLQNKLVAIYLKHLDELVDKPRQHFVLEPYFNLVKFDLPLGLNTILGKLFSVPTATEPKIKLSKPDLAFQFKFVGLLDEIFALMLKKKSEWSDLAFDNNSFKEWDSALMEVLQKSKQQVKLEQVKSLIKALHKLNRCVEMEGTKIKYTISKGLKDALLEFKQRFNTNSYKDLLKLVIQDEGKNKKRDLKKDEKLGKGKKAKV